MSIFQIVPVIVVMISAVKLYHTIRYPNNYYTINPFKSHVLYFTYLIKLAFKGEAHFRTNDTCNCSRATDKPPLAIDDKEVHYNAIVAFAQS